MTRRLFFQLALFLALKWPFSLFAAPSASGTPRIMTGPMAGYATHDTLTLWMRLSGEFPVKVQCATQPDFSDARFSDEITARAENDLAVNVVISGLQPDTRYYYRIYVDGKISTYAGKSAPDAIRTAPHPGKPAKFTVAFGSCARRREDAVQKIWTTVRRQNPDLFFWLGDNIYGDSLVPEIALAEEYRAQRNVPLLQPLLRTVPQLAIWDDHDFALNDHDRTNPVKDRALTVFKWYWCNPAYGLPEAPGVFFRYSYGGVDFFFLDGRYYRDPNADPDTPNKTFLGKQQREWLMQGLRNSTAPFKIIACGSGWTAAKGAGGDSWAAFLHERNALFDFIRDNKITGVVLLSGDTHTGECNAIDWSRHGGYDLYDLVSSPLAQDASNGWRKRTPEVRLRPGFEKPNVGITPSISPPMTPPSSSISTAMTVSPHGNPCSCAPATLRTAKPRQNPEKAESRRTTPRTRSCTAADAPFATHVASCLPRTALLDYSGRVCREEHA